MRVFGKMCVGDQIFHDDEYHCAYANATFLFDKIMLIGKFRYSRVYLR